MHYVPEGYMMPRANVVSLWGLWIFGCRSSRIRPLRFLKGESLSIQSQCSQLSKARYVMNFIKNVSGKSYEEIYDMGATEAERLCRRIYDQLLGNINGHTRMMYSNVYTYFKRIERHLNNQNDT